MDMDMISIHNFPPFMSNGGYFIVRNSLLQEKHYINCFDTQIYIRLKNCTRSCKYDPFKF